MTVGEKIKQLRKERGMTQEELGKAIGVQKAAINKYETGIVVNLKREVIGKLAKALQVSPVWLIDESDDDMSHASRPIVVPDSAIFTKIAMAMTPEDYQTVMSIFEKTYNKMKERGEIE